MPFERAQIISKPASVGTGIKVSLSRMRGAAAKMKFSFNENLAKTFGWSDGDKLEVMIGTGEHHGLIRMRKNNSIGDGEISHRKALKGGYFQIGLGHQPAFIDRPESARWCQFETVEDGWLEIVLPRWADETAPKKAAVQPPAPKGQVAPPPTIAKAAITGALMGDPPPGRRQMLEAIGKVK